MYIPFKNEIELGPGILSTVERANRRRESCHSSKPNAPAITPCTMVSIMKLGGS